jgi:hypothetical protein
MAKKQSPSIAEPSESLAPETPKVPEPDLALRICARIGMGLTICRERMAGNEEALERLLAENDVAGVAALLEPSNKA